MNIRVSFALVALSLGVIASPAPATATVASPIVAVIDSGIVKGIPELVDSEVVGWKDFVNFRTAPYDDHGHGTAVASRVAGKTLGAMPGARLMIGKVLNKDNALTNWGMLTQAIRWATDGGADVINVSIWGSLPQPTNSRSVADAITYAMFRGVLVVWIAGNGGEVTTGIPSPITSSVLVGSSSPQPLIVGASIASGSRASFSQRDPEILAHGSQVRVADPYGGTYESWGTSFAAPWVAGAAARLLADGAPRDPDWLKWVLLHSATDNPNRTYIDEGYGFFDGAAYAKARAIAQGQEAVPGLDERDAWHLAMAVPRIVQTQRVPYGALPPD